MLFCFTRNPNTICHRRRGALLYRGRTSCDKHKIITCLGHVARTITIVTMLLFQYPWHVFFVRNKSCRTINTASHTYEPNAKQNVTVGPVTFSRSQPLAGHMVDYCLTVYRTPVSHDWIEIRFFFFKVFNVQTAGTLNDRIVCSLCREIWKTGSRSSV